MTHIIENDVKIDLIGQHYGENLVEIANIQDMLQSTTDQQLIDEYNYKINDLLAQNSALESLRKTLI
jgi:hypothetical protein